MSLSSGLRGAEWRPLGSAIGIGAIGSVIFSLLGLPLAWLLGAMVATTIASLSGLRVNVPNRVRTLFVAILGVMLGSTFTPEIVDQAAQWAGSLAVQAGYVALATALSYTIYLRVGRLRPRDRLLLFYARRNFGNGSARRKSGRRHSDHFAKSRGPGPHRYGRHTLLF